MRGPAEMEENVVWIPDAFQLVSILQVQFIFSATADIYLHAHCLVKLSSRFSNKHMMSLATHPKYKLKSTMSISFHFNSSLCCIADTVGGFAVGILGVSDLRLRFCESCEGPTATLHLH